MSETTAVAVRPWTPGLIPKERYTSARFSEEERTKLWPYVWQVACREEEIPRVGDYVEYTITDQSILVVRVGPEEIKAFYNVCLHRGNQLKQGCGSAREFRCRYHAWRWNLDGSIKDVPDAEDYDPAAIAPECLQLPECLVGTWGGFVFINMDRDAVPLIEFLGDVPDRLSRFEFDKMRFVRYRTMVVDANWKTAMDAFNDASHTAGTHPQLLLFHDDTSYSYEQSGIHSLMYPGPDSVGTPSPRLGNFKVDRRRMLLAMVEEFASVDLFQEEEVASVGAFLESAMDLPDEVPLGRFFADMRRLQAQMQGMDFSAFSDGDLLIGEDWQIFPNINTPSNGGNAFIFRFRPNGLDPESCLFDVWSLQRFPDGTEPPTVQREVYPDWRSEKKALGRILVQDLTNITTMQKGLHSRGFENVICGRHESNIVNYHKAIMSYMAPGGE